MISSLVLRTQSDARLTELTAEGSEAAFEVIVQRYQRELLAYCSRLLLDPRAEDAVQQALLAAWSALRAGSEVHQLRPWLYRIVHNQALSVRRRPDWGFAELTEQISGQAVDSDDLERRILMRQTLAALAALSDTQREAILRTAVEGESYAEAAEAMGLSTTAVRGLVQRARVNLRSAVAAFTPTPVVLWAAGIARRHTGLLAFLSDTVNNGAGGGAGAGAGVAVAVKSAAIIASSAVVLGGGLAATHPQILHLHADHQKVLRRSRADTSRARTVSHFTASRSRGLPRAGVHAIGVAPMARTGAVEPPSSQSTHPFVSLHVGRYRSPASTAPGSWQPKTAHGAGRLPNTGENVSLRAVRPATRRSNGPSQTAAAASTPPRHGGELPDVEASMASRGETSYPAASVRTSMSSTGALAAAGASSRRGNQSSDRSADQPSDFPARKDAAATAAPTTSSPDAGNPHQ